MRCEVAQRAISESMDLPGHPSADVESHAARCRACSRFRSGAWRLRELSRFEPAPPVPDLVPAIMRLVEREARVAAPLPDQPRRPDQGRRQPLLGRAAGLAVAAGLVVGFVVTAGGVIPRQAADPQALAEEIPERLVEAAVEIEGYRATFEITELNWTREVTRRTFVAHLTFVAPEAFRVEVLDTTAYPSDAWPRNDLLLETDGRTWRIRGPDPCPAAALPECPPARTVERSIHNRSPFDEQTAMPTDVIVPMTVLAAQDRIEVLGPDLVDGRDAVAVALAYEDATPLFSYLRFLGSWREFFPRDRVAVWLDRETWFPLRYEVFPAPGAERSLWAAQEGLPADEPSTAPVFVARGILDPNPPASPLPPPAGHTDGGFVEAGSPGRPEVHALLRPAATAGLRPWRAGRFPVTSTRPYSESVAAYAAGLSWLTVTRVDGWDQNRPFGVGTFAEGVALGRGGVGYYEPATDTRPRRVALHTAEGEFLVASNLPRDTLLEVAGSLPAVGIRQPEGWRVQRWAGGSVTFGLTPDQAMEAVPFGVLVPGFLPEGHRPAAAAVGRSEVSTGVTIVYRRPAAELDGEGIRLHQAIGETLAPPSEGGELAVPVGDSVGRWSPEDHRLEWMDGDVYRSLSGRGFDLATLLRIATSLRDEGVS